MDHLHIHYDYLDIYDSKVFTKDRAIVWKSHILDCYEDVFRSLKAALSSESPVLFNISLSLLDEVIVDAIIGMRKIVSSENNLVEDPNAFKIAAYLSYWWLRHKPVYIHYPSGFRLEDIEINDSSFKTEEEHKIKCQNLCWQLKHINELVAVQIVFTYIFDLDNRVCSSLICASLKTKEGEKFPYSTFDDMLEDILKKLTYHFAYRAIAPKVIEHMLEAYAFHPAWGLTGAHWRTEGESQKK